MLKTIRKEIALWLAKLSLARMEQCLRNYEIAPEGSTLYQFSKLNEAIADVQMELAFSIGRNLTRTEADPLSADGNGGDLPA